MTKNKKEWAQIISNLDPRTKALGLIALVAEALFLGAITVLREHQLLLALYACAGVLIVTIIGIVVIEVVGIRARQSTGNRLSPSPLTPDSGLLSEVINGAIQTVCRAVSLPQTPQNAKLRVFIFRKDKSQLVCTHYWSQDPVTEQVGKLRFEINSDVAKSIAVVRAAVDERICRTSVEPVMPGAKGVIGDLSDELKFVLAAPIKDGKGNIWGTVDLDTATEAGKALLSSEVSDAVMFQLARLLSVIFTLEDQP